MECECFIYKIIYIYILKVNKLYDIVIITVIIKTTMLKENNWFSPFY